MKKLFVFFVMVIVAASVIMFGSAPIAFAAEKEVIANRVKDPYYINYIEEEIQERTYGNSIYGKLEASYGEYLEQNKDSNFCSHLLDKIDKSKKAYEIEASYSIYLYDFSDIKKGGYICTQFENGGYAIFDRETLEIYERCDEGYNPYHAYRSKKCYYGGPCSYVYYNRDYFNIMTGDRYDNPYMMLLSEHMKKIKDNVQKSEEECNNILKENAAANVTKSYNSVGWHLLGEGNPTGDQTLEMLRGLYFFYILDFANADRPCSYVVLPWQLAIYGKFGFLDYFGSYDALMGANVFGSCTMVAMGMLLQYYERLGFANTVPDDLSAWGTSYQYGYTCPDVNPNTLIAERLHQYLISLAHPGAVVSPTLSLATSFSTANTVFGTYFQQNPGVTSASRSLRGSSRTALLDAADSIYDGNPVMLDISGDYRIEYEGTVINGTVGQHAVVAYGYSVETYFLFWKRVDEFMINLGWMDNGYSGIIYINSNIVDNSLVLNY